MTDHATASGERAVSETAVAAELPGDTGELAPPAVSRPSRIRIPVQVLVDLLRDLAVAVVVCLLLITYVVQAFKVQGTSMSPELVDGDRILVNKLVYYLQPIERGDVVVFWYPEDPDVSFIKRVIGLPGDTVEIRRGKVFVNGDLVSESYVLDRNTDGRSLSPREVRPGHYFVLGDNRRGSNDSRSWGLVPRRYIYGEAFLRVWPLGKLGTVD